MFPRLTFHPPVIAHRGAKLVAPENTISALRSAREQGVVWVEVDAKLTYDGVPVLMHDESLERTTNGKGIIADTRWETVCALDAGGWFDPRFAGEKVPHLADVLREVLDNGLRLNVEIKPCPGRARATTMVTLIEMAKSWPDAVPPPLISSFSMDCLEIAAQLQPLWPRGLLLDEWREDWQTLTGRVAASSLHVAENVLTKERAEQVIKTHLPLLAYTVNNPARAKELLDWGLSAVLSDDPRGVLEQI